MKKTIVDSGHWIGAFYEGDNRDKWYKYGKEFQKWFDKQDKEKSRIIITYSVVTEVISRLISKKGFKVADRFLKLIEESNKIDLYNESKELEKEIYETFRKYEGFTLVDSEIFVMYYNLRCDQLLTTADEFNKCAGIYSSKIPT